MLREVLENLVTTLDGVYVDATLGGGGHAEGVLKKLSSSGELIGIDADQDACAHAQARLQDFGERMALVNDNFQNLGAMLSARGVQRVAGVLFDLGVSSFQLDEASKGFSFRADERLDMRMDRTKTLDAGTVINSYEEKHLMELLWNHGEEKHSRRIAKTIVQRRAHRKIETTGELSAIVESVVGARFLTKSLARVFQAIRIEVNDELENLKRGLSQAIEVLQEGGRIVVISYHSLEDRIVKQTFKAAAANRIPSGNKLAPDMPVQPRIAIVTKKPIRPSASEISNNPRARSAKLRVAEKL